jgi:hypothetical protein
MGLSSLSGEAALEAVADICPALEELKQRTLADAVGPRQKALLAPLIDTRRTKASDLELRNMQARRRDVRAARRHSGRLPDG